jgi:Flp pilus assembly protein TadG
MKRVALCCTRSERGAAAVEFALILPVFLLIVLGTIDFGYFFFVSEIVGNAAREGARAGSVVEPDAGHGAAASAATTAASNSLTKGGLKNQGIAASVVTVNGVDAVQVSIVYPVGSITGFLGNIMPANAHALVVMRWQ